jgi:ADP-ribose pyrophosphatase YjhB (NUDIX family)
MGNRSEPTLIDRGFRVAYFCAYRAMRTYWKIRRPTTHGTLVALWNRGEILLVRNSYVPYYSLPGGYMRRGEEARDAVIRELREEVGIGVTANQLELVLDKTHEWEGKHDHVQIFSVDIPSRPEIQVDHREVIEASWWAPAGALNLVLFPPLREVIERRVHTAESA